MNLKFYLPYSVDYEISSLLPCTSLVLVHSCTTYVTSHRLQTRGFLWQILSMSN